MTDEFTERCANTLWRHRVAAGGAFTIEGLDRLHHDLEALKRDFAVRRRWAELTHKFYEDMQRDLDARAWDVLTLISLQEDSDDDED